MPRQPDGLLTGGLLIAAACLAAWWFAPPAMPMSRPERRPRLSDEAVRRRYPRVWERMGREVWW